MRTKTKIFLLLNIISLLIFIACVVLLIIYNYNLWLNEYNAQIKQLGVYKEDLHILNQEIKKGLCITGIIFSSIFIIINITCIINVWLDR